MTSFIDIPPTLEALGLCTRFEAGRVGEVVGVLDKLLNAIPSATPDQNGEPRSVLIGSYTVGGILLSHIIAAIGAVAGIKPAASRTNAAIYPMHY